MLLITVIFIWIALVTCIILFLQSAIVWFILKRRYLHIDRYDELNDEQISENSIKCSNDDDGNDNQIELEQRQQYCSRL
jgi:hypothetical protein